MRAMVVGCIVNLYITLMYTTSGQPHGNVNLMSRLVEELMINVLPRQCLTAP